MASRGSGLPNGKLDPELLERLLGPSVLDASVRVGPGPGRDVAVVTAIAPDIFVVRQDVTRDGIDELADAVFRGVKPVDTLGTPPAYRKTVVRGFVRQILDELLSPR